MTGVSRARRPVPLLATIGVALLFVCGPVAADSRMVSHFEDTAVPVSAFFNGTQWLYDDALAPVDVPMGVGTNYGSLQGDDYEVISYSNGVVDGLLSRGPGAMGNGGRCC